MRNQTKMLQLTAVIEREEDGYVATCQELDIVSQGDTVEGARLNLVEAVEGFLEVASPSEIRRRLKKGNDSAWECRAPVRLLSSLTALGCGAPRR